MHTAVIAAAFGLGVAGRPAVRDAAAVVDASSIRDEFAFPNGAVTVSHFYYAKVRFNPAVRGGVAAVTLRAAEPAAGPPGGDPVEVASSRYAPATLPDGRAGVWVKCKQQFPGGNDPPLRGWLQVVVEYKDGTQLASGWRKPTPVR